MRAHAEADELTLIEAGVLVVRMGAQQAHLEEEVELLIMAERLHVREATHDRGRGVEARPAPQRVASSFVRPPYGRPLSTTGCRAHRRRHRQRLRLRTDVAAGDGPPCT